VANVKSLTLFKWQDESWSEESLSVTRVVNSSYVSIGILFPLNKVADFRVHIACEGQQNVRDKTADGSKEEWKGLISFNQARGGYGVQAWSGCSVSNLQADLSCVLGHQDASINGSSLSEQVIEWDYMASCDVKVTTVPAYLVLFLPSIEKDQHYNFVVSYGGFSWKTMEFGDLSITFDEATGSDPSAPKKVVGGRRFVPSRKKTLNSPVQPGFPPAGGGGILNVSSSTNIPALVGVDKPYSPGQPGHGKELSLRLTRSIGSSAGEKKSST